MGVIYIKPKDVLEIKEQLCRDGRVIRHFDLERACWYVKRYISISCGYRQVSIDDLRYHFCLTWDNDIKKYEECHVFMESSERSYKIRPLLRFLRKITESRDDLVWRSPQRCMLQKPIESCYDLLACFREIADIFDPLIDEYYREQSEIKRILAFKEGTEFSDCRVSSLKCSIVKVKDLRFSTFRIPPYQRTYKWKSANVNQLINDVNEFAKDSTYRLGSLVLHNSDVVDGQQRIVTLSLLLHRMMLNPDIRKQTEYQTLFDEVTGFWKRTEYGSNDALGNIVSNVEAIRRRQDDLNSEFFKTLADNCEFVVIRLPKLHEAFQFFDSQNARGKDLEAHDLLKAYHLREIVGDLDDADLENIRGWQKIPTPRLVSLFLCLYRIRRWSKGESARFFTKSDTGEFKGISIRKEKHPMPLYMQAVLLETLFTEFSSTDGGSLLRKDYPFQLSGVIINGSRFFDMILHYDELYSQVTNQSWKQYDTDARDILTLLGNYDGMSRTGDEYVRNVFDALMLFYVDKFGVREIGKAARLFFQFAYSIRICQFRVSFVSVEKAVLETPLFKIIRDATDPYDILNYQVPAVRYDKLAENKSQDLYQRFEDMNMISYS